jgi:EAL domain-containing protein (putative c-di-GMP-specific phosphodiesterase class I)
MHAAQKVSDGDGERGIEAPPRRARVVIVSECEQRAPAAASPAAMLERATGRRFGVLFQPIIAREPDADGLCRWQYSGAEALVRAASGRGLTVRPDQLLPVVERCGLMPTLFDFVLGETLDALALWQRAGATRLGAAVNLHASALLDERLPDTLGALLSVAGIAPGRLTLEISESAPISDLRRAARTLRRVRAQGVRVALDDFGAGFSTTTRLHWLECDELKIDRALVQGLEYSDEQRCVVEYLVALAHSHGMAALAEGVETEAALEILSDFGCDRAQGYLVARPLPVGELTGRGRAWHGRAGTAGTVRERQLPLPGFGHEIAWRTGGALDAIA